MTRRTRLRDSRAAVRSANTMMLMLVVLLLLGTLAAALVTSTHADADSSRRNVARTEARTQLVGALDHFYAQLTTQDGFLAALDDDCTGYPAQGTTGGGDPCWARLDNPDQPCDDGDLEADCYHLQVLRAPADFDVPRSLLVEATARVRCGGVAERCVTVRMQQRLRVRQFFDFLTYTEYSALDPDRYLGGEECEQQFALRGDAEANDCAMVAYQGADNATRDRIDGPIYTADDYIVTCFGPNFDDDVLVAGTGTSEPAAVNRIDPNCDPDDIDDDLNTPLDRGEIEPSFNAATQTNAPLLLLPEVATTIDEAAEHTDPAAIFTPTAANVPLELTFHGTDGLEVDDPAAAEGPTSITLDDNGERVVLILGDAEIANADATNTGVDGRWSIFVEGSLTIVDDLTYTTSPWDDPPTDPFAQANPPLPADPGDHPNDRDVLGLTAGDEIVFAQDGRDRELHALLLSLDSSLYTDDWEAPADRNPNSLVVNFGDPGFDDTVEAVHVLRDGPNAGDVLVGGSFTEGAIAPGSTTVPQAGLARLHDPTTAAYRNTGSNKVDASFNPPTIDGTVYAIDVDSQGRIYIGGDFDQVNGLLRQRLARLHPDGSLDTSFANPQLPPDTDSDVEDAVRAIAVDEADRPVVGGQFNRLDPTYPDFLARVDTAGNLDSSFFADVDGAVLALAFDDNGRLLAGGDFRTVAGADQPSLTRLLGDGTRDSSFDTTDARVPDRVRAIAEDTDGQITVAGDSLTRGEDSWQTLARVTSSGSQVPEDDRSDDEDGGFTDPVVNDVVRDMVQLPNGELLIAGDFTEVEGETRTHMARLERTGKLSLAFADPVLDAPVRAIGAQLLPAGPGELDDSETVTAGGLFTRSRNPDQDPASGNDAHRAAHFDATTRPAAPRLTFYGAVASRYQGVYGGFDTESGRLASGYRKNFYYDGRAAHDPSLSPPLLISPVGTSWQRLDEVEVAPGTDGLFDLTGWLATATHTADAS